MLVMLAGPLAGAASLTFQAGDGSGFSSSEITFIQGRAGTGFSLGGPDANFGSAEFLVTDDDPPGSGGNPEFESLTRILVQFPDVFGPASGQILPGSSILSASITLHTLNDPFAATDAALSVHQIASAWDEDTVTWNSFNAGGVAGIDYAASPLSDFNPSLVDAAFSFDVTAAVSSWSAGGANRGVIVINPSDDAALFHSDDHPNQNARPELHVEFTRVPEPKAGLLFGLGLLGIVTRRRLRAPGRPRQTRCVRSGVTLRSFP